MMGSEQNRFPQEQQPPPPPPPPRPHRRKRWGGCWSGLSCFGKQKGGKRIVPASRMPESNASTNQQNGPQVVRLNNQATALVPSLLAPPSSPASISNSALPSTAQSPSCFLSLSANSPGGPSSSMFATGPYAHETQLVSPPVYSTFTTEPSTAPLTPPPELAHLTTPSSPDVPFAQFLSSSMDLKGTTDKRNYDLQSTYSLYPGSPASSLISPVSKASGDCLSSSFTEREFPPQWDPSSQDIRYPRSDSARLLGGVDTSGVSKMSHDSNFFCPATFAQFYLDPSSFPHSGGRLSVSKESDVCSNGGNNRHSKASKQDVEEIEAYRASFGFSADEIVTTTQYVEISDVMDDSFSMIPFTSSVEPALMDVGPNTEKIQRDSFRPKTTKSEIGHASNGIHCEVAGSSCGVEDDEQCRDVYLQSRSGNHSLTDDEDILGKIGVGSKTSRRYDMGLSSSDAEIDYRRGRSLRARGQFA